MRVVSVNVGMPRQVLSNGATVLTGIFKQPVSGAVTIRRLNLDGDQQADLSVHGGAEKAVYAYPAEHYEYWQHELPDVPFSWGRFGENLTTDGLREDTVYIGDCWKIGSAVLTVTQPRLPCYKLALRFDRDDMPKRFLASGRTGFYFSVLEEGEVRAGSEIEPVSQDPRRVSVADVVRLYLGQVSHPDLLQRALQVPALPANWKAELQGRAQARRADR
jgi:MOSC domain-containing protein YiiM